MQYCVFTIVTGAAPGAPSNHPTLNVAAAAAQVLQMLGSVKGKRVVELGAGIGRFTGALASAGAANVLAIDFMEHLVAENRRANGHWCAASYYLAVSCVEKELWVAEGNGTHHRPLSCGIPCAALRLAYLVQSCL